MGKNANKKAKFKDIVFEIQKSRFNKALKNALLSVLNCSEHSILGGINFKIDGEMLTLASTDGNTLIKQELIVDELITPGNYQLTLSGVHLSKASFKSSYEFGRKRSMYYLDKLRITIRENSAAIEDLLNGVQYFIPAIGGESAKYPEYEKIIPKLDKNKNYTKVGFNSLYMAKFAEISNPRTGVTILNVNNKNPLAAMVITSNNETDNIKTTAILMPIALRE